MLNHWRWNYSGMYMIIKTTITRQINVNIINTKVVELEESYQ